MIYQYDAGTALTARKLGIKYSMPLGEIFSIEHCTLSILNHLQKESK